MKREGLRIYAFAVTGRPAAAGYDDDAKKLEFELRNVDLRWRDPNRVFGQLIDLRVPSWTEKDASGDTKYTDWFVLAEPSVYHGLGVFFLTGYGWWFIRDGKKTGADLYESKKMMRFEIRMRPEAGLDADGKWLKNQPPPGITDEDEDAEDDE